MTPAFIQKLLEQPALSYLPIVLATALSCWVARSTAIHISKQTDVQLKKPSETYEDFSVCACLVVLMAIARPALKTWPALVTMPIAAAVFAFISNLRSLQASLNAPKPGLLIALGVTVVALVALVAYLCVHEPDGVVPALLTLLVLAVYILSIYTAAKADAGRGYGTVPHVHHFMIGIMLAMLMTNFSSPVATTVAAIGLAVLCHDMELAVNDINSTLFSGQGIGLKKLSTISTSGSTVAVGSTASSQNPVNSVFVGTAAGSSTSASNADLALGAYAMAGASSDYTVCLGAYSGTALQGDFDVAVGYLTMAQAQSSRSVAVGARALYAGGGSNCFVAGFDAGYNVTAEDSVLCGYGAGFGGVGASARGVVGVGSQALCNVTTAANVCAVGTRSCLSLSSGGHVTAIGHEAGRSLVAANASVHLGAYSGCSSLADDNLYCGFQSANAAVTGTRNCVLGHQACYLTPLRGNNNVMAGWRVGSEFDGDGAVLLGPETAPRVRGDRVIAIGTDVGRRPQSSNAVVVSNGCTFLGADIRFPATGASDNTYVVGRGIQLHPDDDDLLILGIGRRALTMDKAGNVRVKLLQAEAATTNTLTTAFATVNTLTTSSLTANTLTASFATVNTLTTSSLTANTLTASFATINTAVTNTLTTSSLTTGYATMNSAVANTLLTSSLTANTLTANTLLSSSLTTSSLTVNSAVANTLTANTLTANTLTTSSLTTALATVNTAVANTLSVSGRSVFQSSMTCSGTVTCNRPVNLQYASAFDGRASTLQQDLVEHILCNTLAVLTNATTNALTCQDLNVNGNSTFRGSLQASNLSVTGGVLSSNLDVSGDAVFRRGVTATSVVLPSAPAFDGRLSTLTYDLSRDLVSDHLTVNTSSRLLGTLDVVAAATFGSQTTFADAVTLPHASAFDGRASTLQQDVTAVPAGLVAKYAANGAPSGYQACDGSLLSRDTYSNLFAVVGTTYGAGDGNTTFALPTVPADPSGFGTVIKT